MSQREHEGLIARIRHLRQIATRSDAPAGPRTTAPDPDDLRALQARVAHLEQLLQGLQDSVHRESVRQNERIAELEAQIQPAAMGKALSDDARERGL